MTPDTNLTSDTVTNAQAPCVLPSTILLLWFHDPHSEFDVLKLPSADQGCQVLQSEICQNVPNYIPNIYQNMVSKIYQIYTKISKKIISSSVKMKSVAFLNDIINFLLKLPTLIFLH